MTTRSILDQLRTKPDRFPLYLQYEEGLCDSEFAYQHSVYLGENEDTMATADLDVEKEFELLEEIFRKAGSMECLSVQQTKAQYFRSNPFVSYDPVLCQEWFKEKDKQTITNLIDFWYSVYYTLVQ